MRSCLNVINRNDDDDDDVDDDTHIFATAKNWNWIKIFKSETELSPFCLFLSL